MPTAIPAPEHIKDPQIRAVCLALAENVREMLGAAGKFDNKALTVNDLKQISVVGVASGNKLFKPQGLTVAGFSTASAPNIVTVTTTTPYISTVSGTGTTRTVTVNVGAAGYYLVDMWLTESANDYSRKPLASVPSGSATTQWREVTDASGVLTKTITHDATGTWYVAVLLLGKLNLSDALAF